MSITVVGLGPAGLDLVDHRIVERLDDPDTVVIARTRAHPGATELAARRNVIFCDDLYAAGADFDAVYQAIAERVLAAAGRDDVVYAVPGSAAVGERTVAMLRVAADAAGVDVAVIPGTSFLDHAYVVLGLDPIADGVQVLDAWNLPDPLPLHVPTIITQVDTPLRAADAAVELMRILPDDASVTVLDRLGSQDETVNELSLRELASYPAGPRTSVYVPATTAGLIGLVHTNRILRAECPWDRAQTHHTLLTHLLEEAYETADAIAELGSDAPAGDPDFGVYAEVEEELGDLLLQVLFHSTLAAEAGAFDVDEVAERIRRKLVTRHPHVFGDVSVSGASEVLANWEEIKGREKQRGSLMDDVPSSMPGVARAMKVQKRAASVGFDWADPQAVFGVVRSELDELAAETPGTDRAVDELGDVLFSVVNLARHLDVDPEVALRRSVATFASRFRHVEAAMADAGMALRDATAEQLDAAWHAAKDTIS